MKILQNVLKTNTQKKHILESELNSIIIDDYDIILEDEIFYITRDKNNNFIKNKRINSYKYYMDKDENILQEFANLYTYQDQKRQEIFKKFNYRYISSNKNFCYHINSASNSIIKSTLEKDMLENIKKARNLYNENNLFKIFKETIFNKMKGLIQVENSNIIYNNYAKEQELSELKKQDLKELISSKWNQFYLNQHNNIKKPEKIKNDLFLNDIKIIKEQILSQIIEKNIKLKENFLNTNIYINSETNFSVLNNLTGQRLNITINDFLINQSKYLFNNINIDNIISEKDISGNEIKTIIFENKLNKKNYIISIDYIGKNNFSIKEIYEIDKSYYHNKNIDNCSINFFDNNENKTKSNNIIFKQKEIEIKNLLESFLKKRNLKLIEQNTYLKPIIKVQDENNNIIELKFNDIMSGKGKPYERTAEHICRQIIEHCFKGLRFKSTKKIVKVEINGKIHNLELDGYCEIPINNEKIKFAFEYNGQHHYEDPDTIRPTYSLKRTPEDIQKVKDYDNKKIEFCKKNNINLIIIEQFKNLEDYKSMHDIVLNKIIEVCKLNNVIISKDIINYEPFIPNLSEASYFHQKSKDLLENIINRGGSIDLSKYNVYELLNKENINKPIEIKDVNQNNFTIKPKEILEGKWTNYEDTNYIKKIKKDKIVTITRINNDIVIYDILYNENLRIKEYYNNEKNIKKIWNWDTNPPEIQIIKNEKSIIKTLPNDGVIKINSNNTYKYIIKNISKEKLNRQENKTEIKELII